VKRLNGRLVVRWHSGMLLKLVVISIVVISIVVISNARDINPRMWPKFHEKKDALLIIRFEYDSVGRIGDMLVARGSHQKFTSL
jgi:hypothetical protein